MRSHPWNTVTKALFRQRLLSQASLPSWASCSSFPDPTLSTRRLLIAPGQGVVSGFPQDASGPRDLRR